MLRRTRAREAAQVEPCTRGLAQLAQGHLRHAQQRASATRPAKLALPLPLPLNRR